MLIPGSAHTAATARPSMHKDVPASLKEHYRNLSANGGDCVSCGGCERRCPFGVHVIERMTNAEKLLG